MKLPIYCIIALLLFSTQSLNAHTKEVVTGKQPTPAISTTAFIQNKGQITDQHGHTRADIDYKLETPGMNIFVGHAALHYQWYRETPPATSAPAGKDRREAATAVVSGYRLDVRLLGARADAPVTEEDVQAQQYHYYLPQCPNGPMAQAYRRITYHEVYPHIDWVLYTTEKGLKYDFVVRPGGDASAIRIQYAGATALALKDGRLVAATPMGSVQEQPPYSYEAATGRELASAYRLEGNVLRFEVAAGESAYVIDPILQWATYFGGSLYEDSKAAAADTAGNGFLGGITTSTTNIATTGAHQATLAGNADMFVAKFNKAGSMLWATYFGGTAADELYDITTDVAGNVYFGGETGNFNGLATSGAHLTTSAGGAILIKLNAAGVRQWSTYYSASQVDALACDPAGNVFITGYTTQTSGAATAGTHLTTFPGSPGATSFIAKFNAAGQRQWGTYCRGSVHDIDCDGSGNIVIVTDMSSLVTGYASPGAHQTSPNDAFIAKFDGSNGTRLWGTYYGGSSFEILNAVCFDPFGNIYIGGFSNSTAGIATAGAYQAAFAGSITNGLLSKFSPTGVRQWGTYFFEGMQVHAVCAGPDGNIYIVGDNVFSGISPLTTTTGAHQAAHAGLRDLFLASFDQGGNRLYTTYYGGPDADVNTGDYQAHIACSQNGKIYFSGGTKSTSGIATTGAYQAVHAGGTWDAFLVQFDADQAVFIKNPTSHTHYCKGDTIKVSYGVTQPFSSVNGFTLQLSDATGSFSSPVTLATVFSTGDGILQAVIPGTIPDGTGYRVRVVASSPAKLSLDNNSDIIIGSYPAKPIAISNTPVCSGTTLTLNSMTNAAGAAYSWTGPASFTASSRATTILNAPVSASGSYIITADILGCIRKDTISVTINETPAGVIAANNSPICSGTALQFTASSATAGVSYNWSGPAFSSTQQNPVIASALMTAAGTYTVTATKGSCSSAASTTVSILQSPTVGIYASPGDTVCTNATVTFVGFPLNAGTPQYQWYKNNTPVTGAVTNMQQFTGLVSGDQVYLQMTGTTACNQPVKSEVITMTVLPMANMPSVKITATPGIQADPAQLITFVANVTHGGTTPKYQWYRNGIAVGTNNASYTTNGIIIGTEIKVMVTSTDPCVTEPQTADSVFVSFPAGIGDNNDKGQLRLYPNPNTGHFTIAGVSGDQLSVDIVNVLGQSVYKATVVQTNGTVSLDAELVPGAYVLRLQTDKGQEVLPFTVE